MEQNILRFFEGYADTIVLATTLHVRPAKPAPTLRQFRSALEFVEAPGARADPQRDQPSHWTVFTPPAPPT